MTEFIPFWWCAFVLSSMACSCYITDPTVTPHFISVLSVHCIIMIILTDGKILTDDDVCVCVCVRACTRTH